MLYSASKHSTLWKVKKPSAESNTQVSNNSSGCLPLHAVQLKLLVNLHLLKYWTIFRNMIHIHVIVWVCKSVWLPRSYSKQMNLHLPLHPGSDQLPRLSDCITLKKKHLFPKIKILQTYEILLFLSSWTPFVVLHHITNLSYASWPHPLWIINTIVPY